MFDVHLDVLVNLLTARADLHLTARYLRPDRFTADETGVWGWRQRAVYPIIATAATGTTANTSEYTGELSLPFKRFRVLRKHRPVPEANRARHANDGRRSDPMIRKMHGTILAMSDGAD